METRSLASLYDFENRAGLFPAVDSRMKFCLLTLTGAQRPVVHGAEFVFFAHSVEDLHDEQRRFTLAAEELALLNPNTRTCPVFRSKRDAELTKAIYRRVPVLIKELPARGNPWGIPRGLCLYDTATPPYSARASSSKPQTGPSTATSSAGAMTCIYPCTKPSCSITSTTAGLTHDGLDTRDLTSTEKRQPRGFALPRYWVPADEIAARLADKWRHGWLQRARHHQYNQ